MVDDVIYIIGGKGEKGIELNDLCAYKIRSKFSLFHIFIFGKN
jgi:hypothetical protein